MGINTVTPAYLVSMVVGNALAGTGRTDVYGPDTSPASAVRDANGQIAGVRRFVQCGFSFIQA